VSITTTVPPTSRDVRRGFSERAQHHVRTRPAQEACICRHILRAPGDPIDRLAATALFSPISARYERGSIVLTSNKGFGEWGEVLGDAVIYVAEAGLAAQS
jgi:hypothetical protein